MWRHHRSRTRGLAWPCWYHHRVSVEPAEVPSSNAKTPVRRHLAGMLLFASALSLAAGCSSSGGVSDSQSDDSPSALGQVECDSQTGACWGPTVERLVDRIFEEDAALAADCREAGRDGFFAAGRSSTGEPPWAEGSATARVGRCEVEVRMVPGVIRGSFFAYPSRN